MYALELANAMLFLSTLSLRRATHQECSGNQQPTDFYPRSPCGERPSLYKLDINRTAISIHALLAESDPSSTVIVILRKNFYPRSPCGERQEEKSQTNTTGAISIHALLAESDIGPLIFKVQPRNFYPRSPCGERHNINNSVSTADKISIHALLAESDLGRAFWPGLSF